MYSYNSSYLLPHFSDAFHVFLSSPYLHCSDPQCTTIGLLGSGSTVNSLIMSSQTFHWLELPKGGVHTELGQLPDNPWHCKPAPDLGVFLLLSFLFTFVSSFALYCSLFGHSPLMLTRNPFTFFFTMLFPILPGKLHPYPCISRKCLQS